MSVSHHIGPIALFVPQLNGGGAQRVIVNLANALVEVADRPIHVVLAHADGEFINELRPEVCLVDLGGVRTSRSMVALSRYLRKVKPVVLMSRMNYANIIATGAWLMAGRPCRLALSEATVLRGPEGRVLSRWRTLVKVALMRICYQRADRVVANSQATADSLRGHGIATEPQLTVIGNPVSTKVVNQEAAYQLDDSGLRLKPPFICAIGRLAEEKGFDVLLSAFAQLPNRECQLVILGEGRLRADLAQQAEQLGIADRLHMPGFVLQPERVLSQAALFVLSSRWEGFGNVLVEALGAGVPIVSTDCSGAPRSLLRDGALGHLVSPDDPEALAHAMAEALHSPRGTREARQQRASEFAAPVVAQQYLKQAFGLKVDRADDEPMITIAATGRPSCAPRSATRR